MTSRQQAKRKSKKKWAKAQRRARVWLVQRNKEVPYENKQKKIW